LFNGPQTAIVAFDAPAFGEAISST